MSEFLTMLPAPETFLRFGVNVLAITLLLFGLYYRRYRDKELVTTASMFNIFAFCVLTVLSSVSFSVTAGFGLFAILALFSLRSEQISKIEITYFFGAISIAVICSVQGTSVALMATVVSMVLLGAYVLDHPRLLRSAAGVKITLDKIDAHSLSDPAMMRADLSTRLGVDVVSYNILALDYINDMARIDVFFRKPLIASTRLVK
jgi:ABC-type antimicrobial peptide transport system permease subunit